MEFHAAGKQHSERMFMAGNQLGKTWAGASEWAMHLTGQYPDWWPGKTFDKPVRFWASGVTGMSTRDNPQRVLVGPPQQEGEWGTGTIPADCLISTSKSPHGTKGSLDNVVVRHVTGGESVLSFKSYEMGSPKWMGETLDGVWFDEEPPSDIYAEGLTRTQAKGLFSILTFTPLKGMSEVVMMFLTEKELDKMKGPGQSTADSSG